MKYLKLKIRYSRERAKNLTLSWECFLGSVGFCIFWGFIAYLYSIIWLIALILFVPFAIWGLVGITSGNAKLKKINQEIEKLKNQLRW